MVVAILLAVGHIPRVEEGSLLEEGDNHLVVGHIPRVEAGSLLVEGGIPLVEGGSCTARGARIRTL